MRLIVLIVVILFTSCAKEIRLEGVILDEQSGLPVSGAKVRTIVDIINNKMEMAEAVSSTDGRFELRFETYRTVPDQLPVELSKLGYQTNMYALRKDSKGDTLILRRD
jgi:5-hydroxyisourate hydrolase-like protein (transthyretin family)